MNQQEWWNLGQVVLVMLFGAAAAGCLSTPGGGDAPGWRTVHRGTFRQLTDFGPKVAMVFDDGRKAVVADNAWENRRLYLVDLESERVTPVDLPDPGRLSVNRFVYGGECVYALFSTPGSDRPAAFRVDRSGGLTPLTYYGRVTLYTDDRPAPGADDLAAAAARGELDGLTELRKTVCRADPATGDLTDAGDDRVHFFVNDGTFVETNLASEIERLRGSTVGEVVDDAAFRSLSPVGDWAIRVERVSGGAAHESDGDGRLRGVTASRNGREIAIYRAGSDPDLFYWVCRVDHRLYLVGSSVRYFDLNTLAPPAGPPRG
ncbi:MAG: hypothetical protein KA419_14065 [Acidobacteria bacterium]|nr:hypothetical protein [Acidobacteriota bacterium]